jgi:hypothetical protein
MNPIFEPAAEPDVLRRSLAHPAGPANGRTGRDEYVARVLIAECSSACEVHASVTALEPFGMGQGDKQADDEGYAT